jgi:hypothetical protein
MRVPLRTADDWAQLLSTQVLRPVEFDGRWLRSPTRSPFLVRNVTVEVEDVCLTSPDLP